MGIQSNQRSKDQTTLVKPIVLVDILPGKKNYVKMLVRGINFCPRFIY